MAAIQLGSGMGTNIVERSETVTMFYNDIRAYEVLSAEKEQELFQILRDPKTSLEEKKSARDKLIVSNQRFAVALAKKYANESNLLDLVNEANIGLIKAIDKFDPSKGVKFMTYAVHQMRLEIVQHDIFKGNAIKKTNCLKTYHTISKVRNAFFQEYERYPTQEEIIEVLKDKYNIDINDTLDVADLTIISLDEKLDTEDADSSFSELAEFNNASASTNAYEQTASQEYNATLVTSLLAILKPQEQEIMKKLFGIGYEYEQNPEDIAKEFGYTSERIRQIKKECVTKMQKEFFRRSKLL